MTLLVILIGIFALWSNIYTYNVNKYKNKIMTNLDNYEKKKAEQQKSKV